MKYELDPMEEQEQLEELEQMEQLRQLETEPPRLERTEDSEDLDAPPRLERGTLGESRDAFNRRRAVERAQNDIQRTNRMKEHQEQLKKDEEKKEAYRNRLYG